MIFSNHQGSDTDLSQLTQNLENAGRSMGGLSNFEIAFSSLLIGTYHEADEEVAVRSELVTCWMIRRVSKEDGGGRCGDEDDGIGGIKRGKVFGVPYTQSWNSTSLLFNSALILTSCTIQTNFQDDRMR
jgi:hypothetical protein